jgi:hypothetical protein
METEMENLSQVEGADATTPNSTSTHQYDHEPYDTFKVKIIYLSSKLVEYSTISLRDRMEGGSFNRVVPVNLINTRTSEPISGIYHIPRFPQFLSDDESLDNESPEVKNHIAILHFLLQNSLPVP